MSEVISSTQNLFAYYKKLGEQAIQQLNDDEIHWLADPNANSIATVAKHMAGNMLSRWTDFLNADGEKEWRDRETEFDDTLSDKQALLSYWEKGWQCVFDALEPLSDDDLDRTIYIRNQEHSVLEAIHRQLTHYAYHVGQIVFIAKTIKSDEWQSLSIPRGQSDTFNREHFNNS